MTMPVVADRAQDDVQAQADAGLLVIHGVGWHARTATLRDVVDPLLNRLRAEGQLINAAAGTVGDPQQPGGVFDAVFVRYAQNTTDELDEAGAPVNQRRLVVIEGRWNDVFLKTAPDRISAWVGRNAPRMMWEVARYHAKDSFLLAVASVATAALFVAAILLAGKNDGRSVLCLAGGLVIGVVTVWLQDLRELRANVRQAQTWQTRLVGSIPMVTLVIFHLQRGFVIVFTLFGALVLPLAAMLLRLLSSLPLLSSVSKGIFQMIEATLMTGGFADMEAVANNQVTAAAVRTRLRTALRELEDRVKPGGNIVVVAHSGGAPPAWRLLSEPETHERQRDPRFSYALLTVGGAINWALHGFACPATPLDARLVNYNTAQPTYWLNLYGTWDPVSHGPVPVGEVGGGTPSWRTWDDNVNRATRNLGAPVPAEHGEYWRNQQEFVPALLRAIDPGVTWAAEEAGPDQQLWSNCRLALLQALVRVRITILAIPVTAIIMRLRGADFFGGLIDIVGRQSMTDLLGAFVGAERAQQLLGFLLEHPSIPNLVILAALALLAYELMDIYTNFAWQSLGRRTEALRPARAPHNARRAGQAALVWLPTVLVLPVVFWAFRADDLIAWVVTSVNGIAAMLEVVWFAACLRALKVEDVRTVCGSAIGRRQKQAESPPPSRHAARRASAAR